MDARRVRVARAAHRRPQRWMQSFDQLFVEPASSRSAAPGKEIA
jgi:hypothetical protein